MAATFLTKEQIFGDEQGEGQLELIRKFGVASGYSDFARVLCLNTNEKRRGNDDYKPTGSYWTSSIIQSHDSARMDVVAVDSGDWRSPCAMNYGRIGARPLLLPSFTSLIDRSKLPCKKNCGVDVVEYGEFPKSIASPELQQTLEKEFESQDLQKTRKTWYIFRSAHFENVAFPTKRIHYEYEYDGKRYIRLVINWDKEVPFNFYQMSGVTHDPCWIEVQPIEWLVEPEEMQGSEGKSIKNPNAGIWLAEQIIFSGVPFNSIGLSRDLSYDGLFYNTAISQITNTYMMQSIPYAADRAVFFDLSNKAYRADRESIAGFNLHREIYGERVR